MTQGSLVLPRPILFPVLVHRLYNRSYQKDKTTSLQFQKNTFLDLSLLCLCSVLGSTYMLMIRPYSGCHSKRKMFLRSLGLANLSCSGQFCAEWVSKRCGSVKSTSSSKRSRSYTLQLCCYRFYMEWTFRKRRIHLYLLLVSIAWSLKLT